MSARLQTEIAIEEIRRRLLAGRFRPGETLRLQALAEEIGVSLTPVREALSELTGQGMLVRRPGVGTSVPVFTVEEIADLIEVRAILEGQAARWSVERCSLGVLTDLATQAEALDGLWLQVRERLVDNGAPLESAADLWADYQQHEQRFHSTLVAAVGSPPLQAAWASCYYPLLIAATTRVPGGKGSPLPGDQGHRDLAALLMSRGAKQAELAARTHVLKLKKSLFGLPVGEGEERLAAAEVVPSGRRGQL
jgi:GntR family transcriptional regulator, vanillate catabolism transcriptional regulator